MIQITPYMTKQFCLAQLEDLIEYIGGEYELTIKDIGDLHDYTIESIELDSVYYAMNAQLPLVFDDCIAYLDDAYDYWDGEAEYRRVVFGH